MTFFSDLPLVLISGIIMDSLLRDINSKKWVQNVALQTPRQSNGEYNRLLRWSVVFNVGKNENIGM